jgi:hypothetical protein
MKTDKRKVLVFAFIGLAATAVWEGWDDAKAWVSGVLSIQEASAQTPYATSRRVARRTSRRTSARHNAWDDDVAVVAAPPGAAMVTTLPSGCAGWPVSGITYQKCGTTYYRPYMQGDAVVYVVEAPPEQPPG